MDDLDNGATADVDVNTDDTTSVTMEDTIAATLRDFNARESTEDTSGQDDALVKEQSDTTPSRTRDADGKFAKTTEVTNQVNPEVINLPEDTAKVVRSAPNTWKKEAQEAYLKADPIIQAEVDRREADIHKGIEQYKQAADWARTVDQVISPYKQTFQQLGISPERAIGEVMEIDHRLRHGTQQEKQDLFVYLSKVFNVDLGQVNDTAQVTDPRIYQYQEQNQRLQNQLQHIETQAQQREYESLHSEIASFQADPAHSHFEAVRGHMVALLQANQAKDLKDAYEQAIYANPVTRAAVLQQRAEADRTEAAKRAQTAKAASSVNLRSRPALAAQRPIGSVEDTIRERYRELTGT